MNNRCVIVGGGDCSPGFLKSVLRGDDYIICADSGYDKLKECDFSPSLIVGDFDSLVSDLPHNIPVLRLPVEKDVTDTESALNEGIKKGFTSFLILGGTGGRFEHTYANIILLAQTCMRGYSCVMADEKHNFYCIHNSRIELARRESTQISVFAFGEEALNVSETGFHYELNGYNLSPFELLGVSNDITAGKGVISVEKGTLIVIETQL